MESTANIHKRLEQALRAETRRKIVVHALNQRKVKHFAKAPFEDAKNDRLDSQLFARLLMSIKPSRASFSRSSRSPRAPSAVSWRSEPTTNPFHKQLRQHFPSYRRTLGIGLLPICLLVMLADRPSPHFLLETSPRDLAEIRCHRHHRVSLGLAEKRHSLAVRAPRLQLPKVTCMLKADEARRVLYLNELLAEVDRAMRHRRFARDPSPQPDLDFGPGAGPGLGGRHHRRSQRRCPLPDQDLFRGLLRPISHRPGEGTFKRPGPWVGLRNNGLIEVESRNGIGATSKNLAKMCTHGFTTKDDGHGFGLAFCAAPEEATGPTVVIRRMR